MKTKISESFIKALKPTESAYEVYDTQETGFCLIVRTSGVISFCLRYRNSVGRKKAYTIGKYGMVAVKQARDIAKKLNGQIANGIDIQGDRKQQRVQTEQARQQTLKVFFDERYTSYALSHMKRGEERLYAIEHYFVEPWGDKPLTEINEWLVINWRKRQLKRGLKHGGVNRPVSALKAMMSRAVEWEIIEVNPLANVKALREDPSPVVRYLDESEEKALREALDERQRKQKEERKRYNQWRLKRNLEPLAELGVEYTDYLKPMVLLALNTGMRRGEVFDLRAKDIDFKLRQVTVRGQTSKSGKTRHIPLTEEGFHVLTTWCNQNESVLEDLVFASPVTGERFDNINKAWRSLVKQAGIKDFRFHDTRHSYASKLVMRGADLYVVKELLGHASIETTQRYSHVAPGHKTKAVELLNG